MEKSKFRVRLLSYVDEILNDEAVDDDQTFSEFWELVRDNVDENADDEDIEDLAGDDSDSDDEPSEDEDGD